MIYRIIYEIKTFIGLIFIRFAQTKDTIFVYGIGTRNYEMHLRTEVTFV
jgi:hypothetical protein